MNQKTVIDYLDVRLDVPAGCWESVKHALKVFKDHHDYVEVTPRLRQRSLQINSTDMIAMLGYLEASQMNDLDNQRLKASLKSAIEQLLLRSTALEKQAHYKWCLAALKNMKWGRYL